MILKNFMRHFLMPVLLLFTALLITANAAHAGNCGSTNNNFTMLDSTGSPVGGTNDVVFTWDGTLNTDPATAVSNATITSAGPTPFFGLNWTAYNVKIYGPGSYTISTADASGGPGCPTAAPANCATGGNYNVTVGAGQIMAHMKFAWGVTEGIDVVNVWQSGSWTTLNPTNSIYTGAGGTYSGPTYSRVSTDWNGDTYAGGGMIDGPFPNFNANFNVSVVGGAGGGTGGSTGPEVTEAPKPKLPGCSISMTSVNPLDRGDWWLVAGFLGWLTMVRRKLGRSVN